MKKITLIFLAIIISFNLFAQLSQKNLYSYKPRFNGVLFGVNATDFYRNANDKYQTPLKTPTLGFNAGFIIDIINQRRWGTQLEIKYTQKGATETFDNKSEQEFVTVKSKLDYLQVDFIPIILKPIGFKSFNPYFSGGLYKSFLIRHDVSYQFNEKWNDLDLPLKYDVSQINKGDMGISINAGIMIKSLTIEYHHEFGLSTIFESSNIKNQLSSINLKLTR
jgi:Outer membrane protein beta-barrel domain